MSTRRRAPAGLAARWSAGLAAGLSATLVVAGCSTPDPQSAPSTPSGSATATSGGTDGSAPEPGPASSPASTPDLPAVSADVAADLQALLDDRAAAIRGRDRTAFLGGLARSASLRTTEGGYYDNLAQLPLADFSYRLVPATLVRTGRAYWGVVEVTMRLDPYDARATRAVDRFRFVPAGSRSDSYRIASTTDRDWERDNAGVQQPWDTEPVTVREGAGVLGVFDSASTRQADGVVASVERGLADVAPRVPYTEWGSRAVVYALSDPTFLDGFDDVPGGDPEALDGVAFSVTAADDEALASTRFALSPSLLPRAAASRPDAALDRLVRHELVHVAVGVHDDDAPVWLSEGLAEWVSWQAVAPERRRVPSAALAAVRRGVETMPTDAEFNDADADVHYALAWWVCEWLVRTFGAVAPWKVLDAIAQRPDDDPRKVVRDLLSISVDQLAARGAKLMRETYASPSGTSDPARPSGSATPSDDVTIYD